MNNSSNLNNKSNSNDEIDIKYLFKIIFDERRMIITLTALFSVIAVMYSLSLSNIYKSSALLSPVGDNSSTNQSMNKIGGLAGLAGINISSSGGKSTKAITKIKTLSFFEDNILPNIFLPDLMAAIDWDEKSNTVIYEEGLFDTKAQKWTIIPSSQKSFKEFMKVIELSQDSSTGFVSLSFKHYSPYVAKEWTELVVDQINDSFRTLDKLEAQASMSYLNAQMAQTSYSEIKEVIDLLNTLDFSNIKTNLSKFELKYSVVILDNTVSEIPKISVSYRSDNFLFFYRVNKLIARLQVEEVIMPVYMLNQNEPEKSSFIFSKPEIKSVISNIESLTTFPQDESKSSVSQSTDKPTIDSTADKPTIDLTAEEYKAEAKSSPKDQTKPESKSESDTSPEAKYELSNLESNPYDKNQYLRVISFKEIPSKTFLQGRAKPDIKTTSYNLYENKDDNKLVGVLQYQETGLKVIVNVKWCLNYTPN